MDSDQWSVVSGQCSVVSAQWAGGWRARRVEAMKVSARKLARRKLDVEMKGFRLADKEKNQTVGVLRALRKALNIHTQEIGEKINRSKSTIFAMETRELKGTLTLREMDDYAEAMDCKVVYSVVPKGGRTLEELYEERLWAVVLGTEIRASGQ
jgi:DNA-binding XRE family transcriptional regulator